MIRRVAREDSNRGPGRLASRTAIVTGAARGTGAMIARRFVEEGARVVLADVRDEPGEGVAAELGSAASYQHLDVRSPDEWARVVGSTRAAHGRIDVLVNNAAILEIASIADTSREAFLAIVEVNQLGPFLGIQAVAPVMKEQGGGSIVNIASSDGIKGMNGVAAYASSKWGLRGITKSAAMELARHRIRVNAVCPEAGSVEMSAPFLPPGIDPVVAVEHNADSLLRAPEGYTVEDRIRDVANAVVFLASDDCPTATAADFVVDNGMTAGYIQKGAPGAD